MASSTSSTWMTSPWRTAWKASATRSRLASGCSNRDRSPGEASAVSTKRALTKSDIGDIPWCARGGDKPGGAARHPHGQRGSGSRAGNSRSTEVDERHGKTVARELAGCTEPSVVNRMSISGCGHDAENSLPSRNPEFPRALSSMISAVPPLPGAVAAPAFSWTAVCVGLGAVVGGVLLLAPSPPLQDFSEWAYQGQLL